MVGDNAYPPSKLWKIVTIARWFGVSRDTVERAIRDGRLKTVRLRGHRRITHGSLVRWFDSGVVEVTQPIDSLVIPSLDVLSRPGFVYLFHWNGFYKIGQAVSVKRRLRDFATLPIEVECLWFVPVADYDRAERFLHALYSIYRYRGEWFRLPLEAVNWITAFQGLEFDAFLNRYQLGPGGIQ